MFLWLNAECFLRRVRPLGCLSQSAKTSRIIDRDVSKDLAVQFDPRLFQAADKLAIADAMLFGGSPYAHNPYRAILALFKASSGVGKLETALHRFFGGTIEF